MDELIGKITQAAGIDETTARSALGVIMSYVRTEGPEQEVNQLLEALPGVDGLMQESGGAGGFGGPMAVMAQLGEIGVDMGQVAGIARELVGFGKEKIGDGAIDAIIAQVPGMDQLI